MLIGALIGAAVAVAAFVKIRRVSIKMFEDWKMNWSDYQ